mmetsp:Transcript_12902/g.37169  ORF Transcript_12902/g.37169 Transcript_12902/m.37169 type:complete len:200 (+) Transcript_12902:397-996(+)
MHPARDRGWRGSAGRSRCGAGGHSSVAARGGGSRGGDAMGQARRAHRRRLVHHLAMVPRRREEGRLRSRRSGARWRTALRAASAHMERRRQPRSGRQRLARNGTGTGVPDGPGARDDMLHRRLRRGGPHASRGQWACHGDRARRDHLDGDLPHVRLSNLRLHLCLRLRVELARRHGERPHEANSRSLRRCRGRSRVAAG